MENDSQRNKRIAKNTIYMFIRMMLVMCISFYTSRVVLNTLGIDDFGIYNIVGSIVVFLSFFKNALNNATYRFLTFELGAGNEISLRRTFVMAINTHIILALILLIILESVGVWFLNNKLNIPIDRMVAANWVFQFSVFTFFIEVVKTPFNSSIISHEQMNFYAYTGIIEVLFKLGIIYILLLGNWDKLILYGILIFSVSLIMFIWYIVYCYYKFPETHYKFHWESKIIKGFASYSGWSLLVNASDVSVQQCTNVLLNIFGGVSANAAIGIANQVNGACNSFLSSFTTAFNPQIIKSYAQKDFSYFMNLILTTSKASFFLLFLIAFPIMLNIDFLLKIWLISPPLLTADFLKFIIVYSLIDAISAPLWNAVHATGNLRTHQIVVASIKLLNIPLGYVLLKNGFPLYIIVAIYAMLNGVCCIFRGIYMKKIIGLSLYKYFIGVVGRSVFCVFISSLMPLFYKLQNINEGWTHLCVSFIIFIFPYAIVIYFVGLTKNEQCFVKKNILTFFKYKTSK